jgi:hypothetical protein
MPPGRSGFEFIAKLIELERFAGSHEAFCPDLYSGAAEREPRPVQTCGRISEEQTYKPSEQFSPVHPYRSLNAARLKLSGTGSWNLADHLDDILWLPFVEPGVLFHHVESLRQGPDVKKEDETENLELAKLWDSRGLLALFPSPHPSGLSCRVFNAHKNATSDRQIGDRRWFNSSERHPSGPSRFLPAGPNMTSMHCDLAHRLLGCASDRKDFYHQAAVSRERALTNILPMPFEAKKLEDTHAWSEMIADLNRPSGREEGGDRYGMKPRSLLAPSDVDRVWAGFNSLYQGDHLGVEFALSSHAHLLQEGDLLGEETTVYRHRPFPQGGLWQGLVIDDYFAVSKEGLSHNPEDSTAARCLDRAEAIYDRAGVFGSPEKTVRAKENFKIIGAEVFSDQKARNGGAITVAAPCSKRVPMIALTLKAAALPVISRDLAARLAGNWVSIFMYRRCCSCVLDEVFGLGTKSATDGNDVVTLSRKVAEELVLASIFGLLAVTDISVPYSDRLFATDASMQKGAFTSLAIHSAAAETLWLGGDRKGAYTLLDNPARQQLRGLGVDVDDRPIAEDFPGPCKVLEFAFDCVEICGGSGVLSKAMADAGLIVCTPIDLSASKHYDLRDLKLVNWIFQMLFERRFRSIVCEPVCTTFSPAQHPASRSYDNPLGFDRKDPKTFLGNIIAFRCLAIIWFAWRQSIPSLLEQPRLSKMAWLSFWRYLIEIGFKEAITDSCAFGSIHRKPFRWLGWGVDLENMNVRCPGGHQHVRIEGTLTKASAVYHPGLAAFIAEKIKDAVFANDAPAEKKPAEIESVILNDLLQKAGWKVEGDWWWKQPAHINVLESRSLVALFKHLVVSGGDVRFNALLDSRVAKGAHAKGRSTARALRPSLMRGCALCLAGNLHPSYGFAPTRLNTADAPTRERDLPSPATHSVLDFLSHQQISQVHSYQFSRATTGWVRLYLLVVFCLCPGESAPLDSVEFCSGFWTFPLWIFQALSHVDFAYLADPCLFLGLLGLFAV